MRKYYILQIFYIAVSKTEYTSFFSKNSSCIHIIYTYILIEEMKSYVNKRHISFWLLSSSSYISTFCANLAFRLLLLSEPTNQQWSLKVIKQRDQARESFGLFPHLSHFHLKEVYKEKSEFIIEKPKLFHSLLSSDNLLKIN